MPLPLPKENMSSLLLIENHISTTAAACEKHDFDYHHSKHASYRTVALFLSGEMECRKHHCSQDPEPPMIIYALILIATLLVALCGNLFSFSMIMKIRSLRRHATYKILASLAITDLLVSVFVIPIKIAIALNNMNFCYKASLCRLLHTADVTFFAASVTHLFFIAVDRYISITKPYYYRHCSLMRRWRSCIFFIWAYAIFWGVILNNVHLTPPFGFGETFKVVEYKCRKFDVYFDRSLYPVVFFLPCVIMVYLYLQIWRVAVKQSREIERYKGKPPQHLVGSISPIPHHDNPCKHFWMSHIIEFKATKVIVIVFGTFVLCYTPLCLMTFIHTFIPFEISNVVLSLLEYFPNLSSCLNPFIYCFFHEDFRENLQKMLRRDAFLKEHAMSLKKRHSKGKHRRHGTTETLTIKLNGENDDGDVL
ncbi:trace amine-associated receptor 7f-like [Clytia hemisphaerica]